jgi:UDP-2,3-diacylglucosamine hydrolase
VSGNQLLVVADAHLGVTPPAVEEALLEFLHQAPTMGDSLLVNGDLFDFWFSYKRVIPREGFAVAAALAALRKRMPVVMTGGNHDRWGDDFWHRDLGIEFVPMETTLTIGERRILAVHGDGLTEEHWSAQLMHRITRHPATIATWRALHPDLGFWVVDKMSRVLGNTTRDPKVLETVSARQRDWAARRLEEDPTLGGIVMGHTHRPAMEEIYPGRTYVNPGAWMDGYKYAVITETGARLDSFG